MLQSQLAAAVAESRAATAQPPPDADTPVYYFGAPEPSAAEQRARLDARLDAQLELFLQEGTPAAAAASPLDTSGPEFGYLALLRERYAGCAVDMAAHLARKVAHDNAAVATMLLVFFACRRDSEMVGGLLSSLVIACRCPPHESTLAALADLCARRRDLATFEAVIRHTPPTSLRPVRAAELRELRRLWRREDNNSRDDVLRPARIAAAADILAVLRRTGVPTPPQELCGGATAVDEDWRPYNAEEEDEEEEQ